MASSVQWDEWNGAGATKTSNRNDCDWKTVDDSTTDYHAAQITAGQNSYTKYQAVLFGGTYNSLSNFTYQVDTNTPGGSGTTSGSSSVYGSGGYGSGSYGGSGSVTAPLLVVGAVVTAYTTPSTTASGDAPASLTGAAAGFGTGSTPFSTAGGSTTTTNPIYANAWRTQLQTTSAAPAGEVATVTHTATWTES